MVASVIGNLISIPLIYVFMYTLELGLAGIPIAQGLNSLVIFGTTIVYTLCKPETREVLQPYDSEVFRGWGEYLSVSGPATLMICAEWWVKRFLTVLAGILGLQQLAA